MILILRSCAEKPVKDLQASINYCRLNDVHALSVSAMAPIRSLLSFHHHRHRVVVGDEHGLGGGQQVKEENAKRPKPLPTTAENIRSVTLSDFGMEMYVCVFIVPSIHYYSLRISYFRSCCCCLKSIRASTRQPACSIHH